MASVRFRLLPCVALAVVLLALPACRDAPQPALDAPADEPRVLLPVEQDEQWGYVTQDGEFAIAPQFEQAHRFVANRALIQKNGRYGFIDTTGSVVIPPEYTEARSFSNGFAPVQHDSLWGYVDPSGAVVIPPQFKEARPFRDGLARVRLSDGRTGYVTPADSLVWPPDRAH
jgi:hypothetical protein